MKINKAGLNLIKKFEGCRLEPYLCPAGKWTIGWGHTGRSVDRLAEQGGSITQHQADEILNSDLDNYEGNVEELCPGATPNQFSALVSFAYNCGVTALATSRLRRKFLAGDIQGAADEFLKWVHANGKKLPGLVKRREAERALFLK